MKKIKIGLFVNLDKKQAFPKIIELIEILNNLQYAVYMTIKTAEKLKISDKKKIVPEMMDLCGKVDIVIAIGGDGTFISAARYFAKYSMNILPVNIGNLGFISEINLEEFIGEVKKNNNHFTSIEKRLMLEIKDSIPEQGGLITNEIALTGGAVSRMIRIEIKINNRYFTTVRSDGLIISTPTGSTGHSLSSGGPIVNTELQAIILTPLSAHSLAIRPIVLSSDDIIELTPVSLEKVNATIDGQIKFQIKKNHKIKIGKSRYTFNLVKLGVIPYYDMLKTKLKWNI